MKYTPTPSIRPLHLTGTLVALLMVTSSSYPPKVNLQGLKSSLIYTPFAGESLERIIAKTMPNIELKLNILAEVFRVLNPQLFGKEHGDIANSPTADWVRFPTASNHKLAISSPIQIDKGEWVRFVTKN